MMRPHPAETSPEARRDMFTGPLRFTSKTSSPSRPTSSEDLLRVMPRCSRGCRYARNVECLLHHATGFLALGNVRLVAAGADAQMASFGAHVVRGNGRCLVVTATSAPASASASASLGHASGTARHQDSPLLECIERNNFRPGLSARDGDSTTYMRRLLRRGQKNRSVTTLSEKRTPASSGPLPLRNAATSIHNQLCQCSRERQDPVFQGVLSAPFPASFEHLGSDVQNSISRGCVCPCSWRMAREN